MSRAIDAKLPEPPRSRRAISAADEQKVSRLGARIFAELIPRRSIRGAIVPRSFQSKPSSDTPGGLSSDWASTPITTVLLDPHTPAARTGKETLSMQAYRTESRYYFSSRKLLPVGSLVFFSNKIRRYVHPTDGTLLDPHPRLQVLSDAESQELEAHWQTALARY